MMMAVAATAVAVDDELTEDRRQKTVLRRLHATIYQANVTVLTVCV
jgi:hypothetical protein